MEYAFEGSLSFCQIDIELPPATAVLEECSWDINHHNAPYLAGKAGRPKHELVRLADPADEADLPQAWSEADTLAVVGDINHALSMGSSFIVAGTSDFKQAGELVEKMNYRPALAGEFLQLFWLLRHHGLVYNGYFYCYTGRQPEYATLGRYNSRRPNSMDIIFDTYIGDAIKEGYMSANADSHCFFVLN